MRSSDVDEFSCCAQTKNLYTSLRHNVPGDVSCTMFERRVQSVVVLVLFSPASLTELHGKNVLDVAVTKRFPYLKDKIKDSPSGLFYFATTKTV